MIECGSRCPGASRYWSLWVPAGPRRSIARAIRSPGPRSRSRCCAASPSSTRCASIAEAEALASLAHEGIVGYVAHGRTEGGAAALDLDAIDTRTKMIRLAHILALEASGRRDDAHREATRARAEIEKQAAPISDPEQRAAFCEGISLHRDIFAAERRLA